MTALDVEITSETTACARREGQPGVTLEATDREGLMQQVFQFSQREAADSGAPVEVTIEDGQRRRYVTVAPDGTASKSTPSGPIPTVELERDAAEPVVMAADELPYAPAPGVLGAPQAPDFPTSPTRAPAVSSVLAAPRVSPASQSPARRGLRGRLNGLLPLSLPPSQVSAEMRLRVAIDMITGPIPDFSVITVANLKGGVGKTPMAVGLASTLATHRGGGRVVCADLAEIGGSLADRVAAPPADGQDVVGLLADSAAMSARPAALSRYLSRQPSGEDVIAGSGPRTATGLSHDDAAELAAVLAHHREILVADTGNNRLAGSWQWAVHAASVLIVPVPLRRDAAVAAHRMLLDIATSASGTVLDRTLVIITDGPGDQPMVETEAVEAFLTLGIRVLRMPYEPLFAGGERIVASQLRRTTTDSLTNIAATAVELMNR